MLILVCGLSKSGKTSLIQAAKSAGLGLRCAKASDLLRSSGRPITALTSAEANCNQSQLKYLLTKILRDEGPVILDGHLLIETIDGPQLVPESSLLPHRLVGVIEVTAAPQIIAMRRVGTIFSSNVEEISEFMAIETLEARRLARVTAAPFFQIDHEDTVAFTAAILECIKTADAKCR
jgi:adenylate kinase